MQINKDYDPEINLKDLVFDVLYHWRSILVAALIGAILLGGYQYISISSIHKAGKQTKEEKQYEIDLQNYKDSVENVRTNIRTYTKLIQEQSDYLKESVYMTLDSQNEWFAYKRFYIKMDQAVLDALPESAQEDPADYVASVYVSTLKSGLDAEAMEALLGTGKKDYIDELVSIWADNATNTITLQLIGADEASVAAQMEYFEDRLMTVSAPLAQEVGAHTLALVSQDLLSRTDSSLSSKQEETTKQIVSWQESLKEQREKLNDLEEEEEPQAPGTHVKKFAAIGFILGAFLLAVIYVVKYIMGGKLHEGVELAAQYDLPVYGEFAKSRARRSGKGVDKLLEGWEFKHTITDKNTVVNGICTLIGEGFAGKRLLLTGTCAQQKLDALSDDLSKRLAGTCDLVAQGDLPANAKAISAAKDFDAVILVEEKYVSRLGDIERAAELLQIADAHVAGCVII